MLPACEISSSTIRDLPIPGSPTSSTTRPRRRVADSSASDSARISCSRPIRGGASRRPSRRRSGAPSSKARTGLALPFTVNGGSSWVSNRVRDRASAASVARICPSTAFPMTRAARFTASPGTEYDRRYGGPNTPAKTRPAFTPIRKGSVPDRSMMLRTASSIASSS